MLESALPLFKREFKVRLGERLVLALLFVSPFWSCLLSSQGALLLQCAFNIKLPLNVLTARLLLKNILQHTESAAFVKEKRIK